MTDRDTDAGWKMKDERKRGHVDTVTWGHGAHIRGMEAQRLG
jgi:hypothetical protein